jgi:outer membrane protein assembly factor BamB
VRPGSREKGAELVWNNRSAVPEVPSPLYYKGRVYTIMDGGIALCLDAATGEQKYKERIGASGPYYASPVVGDGKIYVASARGVVSVYETGDTLKVLARNDLGERIMATPALVDGKVYVRTKGHLYAFGNDMQGF